MKRFRLAIVAAMMATAPSYAAEQFTGSFAFKAKYTGKNTYLMDSCKVDYTYKKVVGAPSYITNITWTSKPQYTVGGKTVSGEELKPFPALYSRYQDIAPTKATLRYTVLFYSEKFKCYIGSARGKAVVNNLEKAGQKNSPEILKIGSWEDLFSNVVIGKQSKDKAGTVVADAALETWLKTENMTKGSLDLTVRGSKRTLSRLFNNTDRIDIVSPSVDLEWPINEYVYLNDAVRTLDNMSDALVNKDTVKCQQLYYQGSFLLPPATLDMSSFWNSTVAPYKLFENTYNAAEAAYRKGDYNEASINYNKALDLDSSYTYCKRRIAKIDEYLKTKETRNLGGIEMAFVEGNNMIKSFYISKTEITNRMYRRVMGSNGAGPAMARETMDLPVANLTWDEAYAFVKELNEQTGLNYRLVTSQEWTYAADGGKKGSKSEFAGGNNITEVGWTLYNSDETSHPVGKKEPNELGIYDMTGNVAEWVADKFDKNTRIIKGGSYSDNANNCSITASQKVDIKHKSATIGFRIAQDE